MCIFPSQTIGTENEDLIDVSRDGFISQPTQDGTSLWRKGGLMSNPQFVQVQLLPGELRLEAWVRMVLLPGVYVGEHDLEGMFLVVQKRQLKSVVGELKQLAAG